MRRLAQVFLLVVVLVQTGCFGLIRAILNPLETAQAAGAQLAYNMADNLAGSGVSQDALAVDSLRNVERLIEEHPDAANMGNLERLRDHLKQEVGESPRGGLDRELDPLDTLDDGEIDTSRIVSEPLVDVEHDRHQLDFLVQDNLSHAIHRPSGGQKKDTTKTSLAVEMPAKPVYQTRFPESRHFSVPRQSSLGTAGSEFPMIWLEGDEVYQAPSNRPPKGGMFVEQTALKKK